MIAEVETHNLAEPLKAFFGFGGFKGTQEAIINNILNKELNAPLFHMPNTN